MRSLLLLAAMLCTARPAAAQQPIINVEDPPVATTIRQQAAQAMEEFVPPSDGGLGSTMTIDQQGKPRSREDEESKLIAVQPAGESVPSLKYRLWMPDFSLRPGTAALHFGTLALLMWREFPNEFRAKVTQWSTDGGEVNIEERKKAVDSLGNVFAELHLLANSENMKWDHRLRNISGPDLYAYLLPEIQQSRDLARILRVKIQHQLSSRDFDGVVESLRDGFRLAAFIGQGETLVQQLVGMAIEGVMLEQVEHLIQLPGSPNMYWALATLPRPLTDVNRSIEFELSSVHRVIPALEEAETETRDEAYWNIAWAEVVDSLGRLSGIDQEQKLAFAVLGAVAASPAKQRLIEGGISERTVENMPAMRAVLFDASLEIRRMSDDLAKANFLPNALGNTIGRQEETKFNSWLQENTFKSGGAAIVGLLFPAAQAARAASIRQEYVVNRLMTIEALRMHAFEHDGALPDSLSQLAPVPALPNPFTGEPFDYELQEQEGESSVVLTADLPASTRRLKQITVLFKNRN